MFSIKDTKGYSLVEVLVATGIMLVALVGPMTIASKGLQITQFAREQATAIFMAQEGIEAVVALRNNGIIAALNNGDLSDSWDWQTDAVNANIRSCFSSDGCNLSFHNSDPSLSITRCGAVADCPMYYRDGADVPYAHTVGGYSSAEQTQFYRVIHLEEIGDGSRDKEIKVTSTVYWNAALYPGAGYREVVLTSSVFNLYE